MTAGCPATALDSYQLLTSQHLITMDKINFIFFSIRGNSGLRPTCSSLGVETERRRRLNREEKSWGLEKGLKGEGRMEREIDRRIGAASAVMRTLHGSVVVKRELSRKAKLSIYQSIYVPALTYGHELWVMTERTRSRVQAAEMSFLRRVAGLSLRDRVRSSVIREELGVDPLLLRVERSQMRWLGHLVRMPPGRLPGEVFRARPTGRRPRGRPRTRWRDYVSRLAWERLGIPQEELAEVAGEREVWASLLRLLPPRPDPG
ncbi:putative uncharacterized transposon-derived protein F52C9.6 [Merluccius polli]|uniref:Uncharacterized transposon-derived protein F52C9.6 n=1 Tax=Merluccius polli TaxID=89951 RepID=A0AA47MD38_MERPO|nr:putative uncharacterized transposon-derived protein F52C9.6 [Merluccius polli]